MSENLQILHFSGYIFKGDALNRLGTIKNPENIEKISFDESRRLARITYSSNDFYEGEITPDFQREGTGIYEFSSGSLYKGGFKANEFDGFGVFRYKNGDIYEGGFLSGLKHGFGRYKYSATLEFTGYFRNDLQSGPGVLRDSWQGYEFIGTWNQGLKEGPGCYKRDNMFFKVFYEKNELKSVEKAA